MWRVISKGEAWSLVIFKSLPEIRGTGWLEYSRNTAEPQQCPSTEAKSGSFPKRRHSFVLHEMYPWLLIPLLGHIWATFLDFSRGPGCNDDPSSLGGSHSLATSICMISTGDNNGSSKGLADSKGQVSAQPSCYVLYRWSSIWILRSMSPFRVIGSHTQANLFLMWPWSSWQKWKCSTALFYSVSATKHLNLAVELDTM